MVRTDWSSVGSLPPGRLIGGTWSVDEQPFTVTTTQHNILLPASMHPLLSKLTDGDFAECFGTLPNRRFLF